jgi:phytoene/squalene synthetase
MTIESHAYSTSHEIAFLRDIGTHHQRGSQYLPQYLLKLYRAAMPYRVAWDGIDRAAVEKALDKMIKGES